MGNPKCQRCGRHYPIQKAEKYCIKCEEYVEVWEIKTPGKTRKLSDEEFGEYYTRCSDKDFSGTFFVRWPYSNTTLSEIHQWNRGMLDFAEVDKPLLEAVFKILEKIEDNEKEMEAI